jgi:PKD repeat protein
MTGTFPVIFTASNSLTGRDTTSILVVPAGNQPPVARLSATPTSGEAPLNVSLDGSASTDPEAGALTYRFDFGDGTSQGPQSGATASHSYAAGSWTALLTTTDGAGQSDTATVVIQVTAPTGIGPNLVGNPSFETDLAGWNQYSGGSLLRVAGGKDGGWAVQVTSTNTTTSSFGINDSPNWVANAGAAGTRYRFSAWVRSASATGSAKLQVREYLGATKIGVNVYSTPVTLSPQWQLLTVEHMTGAAGTTLDFQVYESPVALNEVFLVDDVSIRLVAGAGPPTIAANEHESHFGQDPALVFGARMVPSVTTSNATLHFTTTQRGPVQIELFDAAGRRVRTLVDETDMAPGAHSQQFDGRGDHGGRLESGMYFYRVRAAERSVVGRLVLAR